MTYCNSMHLWSPRIFKRCPAARRRLGPSKIFSKSNRIGTDTDTDTDTDLCASWVPPGASWVPPGCLQVAPGCAWVPLGAPRWSWVLLGVILELVPLVVWKDSQARLLEGSAAKVAILQTNGVDVWRQHKCKITMYGKSNSLRVLASYYFTCFFYICCET